MRHAARRFQLRWDTTIIANAEDLNDHTGGVTIRVLQKASGDSATADDEVSHG
jgi:hypothetical protein